MTTWVAAKTAVRRLIFQQTSCMWSMRHWLFSSRRSRRWQKRERWGASSRRTIKAPASPRKIRWGISRALPVVSLGTGSGSARRWRRLWLAAIKSWWPARWQRTMRSLQNGIFLPPCANVHQPKRGPPRKYTWWVLGAAWGKTMVHFLWAYPMIPYGVWGNFPKQSFWTWGAWGMWPEFNGPMMLFKHGNKKVGGLG